MTIVRSILRHMRTIAAGEFKARCLALMDEVEQKRESILITKRGKPVARLVPAKEKGRDELFDRWKGKLNLTGDIISPAFDLDEWEMER